MNNSQQGNVERVHIHMYTPGVSVRINISTSTHGSIFGPITSTSCTWLFVYFSIGLFTIALTLKPDFGLGFRVRNPAQPGSLTLKLSAAQAIQPAC